MMEKMADQKIYSNVRTISEAILINPESGIFFDTQVNSAKKYLESHYWCRKVISVWAGQGIVGIFYSFLIEIEPSNSDIPIMHWVVCGDIPSVFLSTQLSIDAFDVLYSFVYLMDEWIEAARGRGKIERCFPINVPATPEWSDRLMGRVEFICLYLLMDESVPENVVQEVRKRFNKFNEGTFK